MPTESRYLERTLQEAANGLVTYLIAGDVHVLRLADGLDKAVGHGTLARFLGAGLAYADGSRIRVKPYSELSGP